MGAIPWCLPINGESFTSIEYINGEFEVSCSQQNHFLSWLNGTNALVEVSKRAFHHFMRTWRVASDCGEGRRLPVSASSTTGGPVGMRLLLFR